MIPARFRHRPNRFVVEVEVDGQPTTARLPNPGQLMDLLLPGALLWLQPAAGKHPYKVEAVVHQGQPIPLDTQKANYTAEQLVPKLFPGYRVARREVPRGHSRFDFLLEKGARRLLLEVKSCTLAGHGLAMFPDAASERATRHLEELAQARGALLFVVHRPGADWFLPDLHTDLTFARTLLKLRAKVRVVAASVSYDAALQPLECRPLEIPWDLLTREAQDSGAYLVVLQQPQETEVSIGSLGWRRFPAGYTVYVGSARRALSARVARHRALRKRHHWHIDYLRQASLFRRALPVRSSQDLECSLARALLPLGEPIEGFGCSDCACSSHLIHFPTDPLLLASFQEVLLDFRMGTLTRALPPDRRQASC